MFMYGFSALLPCNVLFILCAFENGVTMHSSLFNKSQIESSFFSMYSSSVCNKIHCNDNIETVEKIITQIEFNLIAHSVLHCMRVSVSVCFCLLLARCQNTVCNTNDVFCVRNKTARKQHRSAETEETSGCSCHPTDRIQFFLQYGCDCNSLHD